MYAEVRVPRFRRSFTLSRELDSQKIEANLKDGVLTLRIPKQAYAQPRRIEVRARLTERGAAQSAAPPAMPPHASPRSAARPP